MHIAASVKGVVNSQDPAVMGSTPARKSRMHADDRHDQLLRVAIEVFARNGFSGTKTKDIALAAGVSEAILFRHFATKEDLYHAILDLKAGEEGAGERERELQGFMERREDAGLLRCFARQLLVSFAEDPGFHRLMLYALLEGHLLANLFRERFVLPTDGFLCKYIVLRQKEGAFRKCDAKVAARFAISTFVHFAMSRHVFGLKRAACGDAAILDELVQLVLAGLIVPGSDFASKPVATPPVTSLKQSGKPAAKKNSRGNGKLHQTRIEKDFHAKS